MPDEAIVIGIFALSHGAILFYALYLHRRRQRAEN